MTEDHRQSCTVENGQSCLTQEEEQEPVVEKELCQLNTEIRRSQRHRHPPIDTETLYESSGTNDSERGTM